MTPLQRLRRHGAGLLGRGVLLWFALTLGAAMAAPMVNAPALELVCSSAGALKLVVPTDGGVPSSGASHLSCPLCTPTGAPPPVAPGVVAAAPQVPSLPLPSVPAQCMAAAAAPPLPARGPPTS